MDRREFVKVVPLTALPLLIGCRAGEDGKIAGPATSDKASRAASGASGAGERAPDWVTSLRDSDMDGLGPDGKPVPGYKATGTGHARTDVDPSKPHQMTLTREEQDILDGKKGAALAKVMKTVVAFGNAFGAAKLVDLGGAPHSSVFNAPPFMKSLFVVFTTCAVEGLKSYAPFTVNPRPFYI